MKLPSIITRSYPAAFVLSQVEGSICIQSTAPISPGNSGGPLIDAKTRRVVGINFASAAHASAENVNFAVPSWRAAQIVGAGRGRQIDTVTGAPAAHAH